MITRNAILPFLREFVSSYYLDDVDARLFEFTPHVAFAQVLRNHFYLLDSTGSVDHASGVLTALDALDWPIDRDGINRIIRDLWIDCVNDE